MTTNHEKGIQLAKLSQFVREEIEAGRSIPSSHDLSKRFGVKKGATLNIITTTIRAMSAERSAREAAQETSTPEMEYFYRDE